MLILKRKVEESIWIGPGDVALDTPIGEVFSAGPIEVLVSRIQKNVVVLGVDAPPSLLVLRDELFPPVMGEGGVNQPTGRLLGQKLITLRFIKKMSRKDLARVSGVPVHTIIKAENFGVPIGLDEVGALAKGLGISVAELMKPPGTTVDERVVMALLEQIDSEVRADS